MTIAATARDSPLSIALLCESFGALGGVAQIVEDLATQFARAGHRVAIVSNPHKGNSIGRPVKPSIEQIWVDLPRVKPFSLRHPERLWRRGKARDLTAFICEWRADVINIHGGLRDRFPAALAAIKPTQVPLVQSFHLVPEALRENREAVRLQHFSGMALRAARAITFPSTAVKEGFRQIWADTERAQIIRGGVNIEDARRAMPIAHRRPYIFSASRFDLRHKAVDALIEAFRLLADEFADVDLLIAGDGPQRPQLEELVAASGLEARISLLPALPHDQLWSLYKGALLFAMLSRMKEGLPLVFFEAMACGKPVIGTRTGGTPEIVQHEDTGLLLESNQPDEIAAALQALLANPQKRDHMGRRGYEVVQSYDWQVAASSYVQLYKNVLGI